ncbi:hypothetical protein LTR84_010701 [Exophiala bonariae]|uniref:Uncharacterized protein n=1 Tax=Exophiala bonariae TaxID=1690606 RepID=A0AAV9MT51_9EURO|nr:hypothetical protein LTR84_010701 [Exophiala bonariae]
MSGNIPSLTWATQAQLANRTPDEIEAALNMTKMSVARILSQLMAQLEELVSSTTSSQPKFDGSTSLSQPELVSSTALSQEGASSLDSDNTVPIKLEPASPKILPQQGASSIRSPSTISPSRMGSELAPKRERSVEDQYSSPSKRRRFATPKREVADDEVTPNSSRGQSNASGSSLLERGPVTTESEARDLLSAEPPVETKKKRSPKGEGSIKAEEDRIFRSIREGLNSRSARQGDYQAFADAMLPDSRPSMELPIFTEEMEMGMRTRKPAATTAAKAPKVVRARGLGASGTLHPSEVALCQRLNLPYDVYRCQKSRIFLGMAAGVAFYERKLAQEPSHRARDFGVSQGQQIANIDVKITSTLMRAFEVWGWVPQLIEKDARHKRRVVLTEVCQRAFPSAHRLRLLLEVAGVEAMAGKLEIAGNVLSEREKRGAVNCGPA